MSSRKFTSLAALAALAVAFSLPHADAQPAQGVGTVKVTVVDAQGAAIQGIKVQLRRSPREGVGGGDAGAPPSVPNASGPAPLLLQQQGILVASKDTDKDGKVEFTNVKAGSHRVSCGNPQLGRAFAPVRVEPNKVHEIKLEVKKDN